jgi:gliding motility-associated-like protein
MIVKYYDQNNALLSSPLPNPFTTSSQNIKVEVINSNNLNCKSEVIIPFKINKLPVINLTGSELVCSNNPNFTKIIDAGLIDVSTVNDFQYKWFFNGAVVPMATNYALTVNESGIYTVAVTSNLGCSRTRTITVVASNTATINAVNVTDLTDNNTIEVIATGLLGDYVYSLDNQNYQSSPVFTNVAAGIYTVYVKDINGCGTSKKEISVLGIPKFFTPNGDGFNDTWKINGINRDFYSKTIMYIFDRFGKLIVQITPLDNGWDGKLNGQPLPADDYWYVLQLDGNRTFKGHFTLKR